MINLRIGRQTSDFDCGVTALQVVMEHYGVYMPNKEIMKKLKTDEDGTRYENMIALAERKGFTVFASEGITIDEVKIYIDKGYPVIVLLQAWAERYMTIDEWQEDFDDGHYVVVIGYQEKIIIFEDPSSTRRTWLTEEEFLACWHDKDTKTSRKLEHFVMVLMGKKPVVRLPEHMG